MTMRISTIFGIAACMASGIAIGILGYRLLIADDDGFLQAAAIRQAIDHIRADYVAEVPEGQLVEDALRGMLGGLDRRSAYLDQAAVKRLEAETDGRFGGIGIELSLVEDQFRVIAPMDGTPAARAGLAPGDRILALNREPLAGKKLLEVVGLLRGPPGTDVLLTLSRADEQFDLSLTRARILVESVRFRWLAPGHPYIRIARFQRDTAKNFAAAIESLQGEGTIEGLVLDLRNNPGGVLGAAVDVADALLDEGLIVYTEGRSPSSRRKFQVQAGDLLQGAPVAVLINRGTASAAEIVAGALHDHERAVLIGAQTYGKGSVQAVLPLRGNRALKLTTAHYFTPDGNSIEGQGVIPDLQEDPGDDEALLAQALQALIRPPHSEPERSVGPPSTAESLP